jgi:hypothetical protein
MTIVENGIKIDWASPQQEAAFCYGPLGAGEGVGGPLLCSGGFGSAKTYALCLKILWLCDAFPNNRVLIARSVWEELRVTTMSTFYKICPPWVYKLGARSDSQKFLRLNNGSEILWMHMDDPEVEGAIRGFEMNAFFLDQAEQIDEELFDLLMGRLGRWDKAEVPQRMIDAAGGLDKWAWKNQTGKPIPPIYALLACNPDHELHWLYKRFHPDSPDWHEKYRAQGYRMITMRSDENKFLPRQNLDILMSKDESFQRRYVRGEWGLPEGQIHQVSPESLIPGDPNFVDYLRQTCLLYRAADYGDAAPTAVGWFAVDQAGNCFCFREYYVPNKLISYHRERLRELSDGERYVQQPADPSIFSPSMQKHGKRWSVAEEFADRRNHPRETAVDWERGDNDELGTRNKISEFLRVDPLRIHPYTKKMGAPRLFFVQKSAVYPAGCYHVIRETRSQKYEKIGSDGGRPIFCDDRDESIADHAYDYLRYFMATQQKIPVAAVKRYGRNSFAGAREQLIHMRKSGGMAALAEQARSESRAGN